MLGGDGHGGVLWDLIILAKDLHLSMVEKACDTFSWSCDSSIFTICIISPA